MKVKTMAANDAYELGMNRLILDDIAWKTEQVNGYHEALDEAWKKLDLKPEAEFFAKYRNKIVKKGLTGEKAGRSFRKTKIVLVVGGVIYLANYMGYLDPAKRVLTRKLKEADARLTEHQAGLELKQKVQEIKDTTAGKIDEQMEVYGLKPADPPPHNVFEPVKPADNEEDSPTWTGPDKS